MAAARVFYYGSLNPFPSIKLAHLDPIYSNNHPLNVPCTFMPLCLDYVSPDVF